MENEEIIVLVLTIAESRVLFRSLQRINMRPNFLKCI